MRRGRREPRRLSDVLERHDAEWGRRQYVERNEEARRQQQKLSSEIQAAVVEHLKRNPVEEGGSVAIQNEIKRIVPEIVQRRGETLPVAQVNSIIKTIIDEITGYGPLEPLLSNPKITEIMVNNHRTVFVEEDGRLKQADVQFDSPEHVRHVIERIIAPLGRRIDESSPMVDARLPDGSRVNAMIPPLAIDGPNLTIRKFPEHRLDAEDLLKFGSATPEMMDFLEACIKGKMNIIISGGTGSGKTTLLNVSSNFIPADERIITIEDSAELRLSHMHEGGNLIRLESKPPNIEGKGEVSIRDLVRNSLRMRPDRIIVGECRAGEAVDMLQAMNTGHEGSMTTLHANNPREAVSRLEMLVLQGAPELPHNIVRYNIAQAVDLIIQQNRLQDGSRKITSITEVAGVTTRRNEVVLNEIFRFEQTGVDENGKVVGEFKATGNVPSFLDRLNARGVHIDPSIFEGGGD